MCGADGFLETQDSQVNLWLEVLSKSAQTEDRTRDLMRVSHA